MPVEMNSDGKPVLRPQGLGFDALATLIHSNVPVSEIKRHHAIEDAAWDEFALAVGRYWRALATGNREPAIRLATVNEALANYALGLPDYLTEADLQRVEKILAVQPLKLADVESEVFRLTMLPDLRAVQLHGRFMALPIFSPFAYIIDSAGMAYFRGNIAAAFFSILPVVEGVLLRWQGFPSETAKRPTFRETTKFLRDSRLRQPMPFLPTFYDGWINAAVAILERHFFLDTKRGSAHGGFNRHLALHLLADEKFCTPQNLLRAFLLLDLLAGIYVCETRSDPRFHTSEGSRMAHRAAYITASNQNLLANQPEHILFQTHESLRFMTPR